MSASKTVLLVDDELDILETVGSYLEKSGYRVIKASDGLAAREQASKMRPDLIVLDLMLPGMNGWKVCQEIKLDPALKTTPVILLSAMIQQDSEAEKGIDQADYFMTKPYHLEELGRQVARLLAR
jgi:DNA-binding response OmpR family regulator